ncbi:MAG: toll/interleukin-1 receptor domain-containing protein [Prevotella sp.]|nr:toll/interleukin-1 receptor domain-containing protein [Prevotella sp.]
MSSFLTGWNDYNSQNMEQNKEYFVFISYSSLDNEWAIWLKHELEHYHLPASFNGRTDVRGNLRKVFRDRDELSTGSECDAQVQKVLDNTNNLIVIRWGY